MKIEVLVATMNQENHKLIEKMNIQTNAIICNQSDNYSTEEIYYENNHIRFLSFNERGVGLNRNNALMRSNADICILADDDMVFVDDYEEKIRSVFKANPDADVVILNLLEPGSIRYVTKKKFKVRFHNFMRFGAARIAYRNKSVTKEGISFNIHFGGGTQFSAGEDALFLASCLKKKLKVIAVPTYIAELSNDRESTWFEGFNDKYFFDKGVLYAAISRKFCGFLALQYVLRRRFQYKGKTPLEVWKLIRKGINHYKRL